MRAHSVSTTTILSVSVPLEGQDQDDAAEDTRDKNEFLARDLHHTVHKQQLCQDQEDRKCQ